MPANEDPKLEPKTPEAEMLDRMNAIVTSHLKRAEKQSADALAKLVDEKLTAFAATLKPADPPPDTKGKVDPEIAALRTKLEEYQRQLADSDKARAAAELAQRDEATFGRVKSLLEGVRPELRETAAKILYNVDKRVTFDEKGNPLFRARRAPAPGMSEEDMELPLDDGIQHWLKSKEAAAFLPAPQASPPPSPRGGRNPSPGISSGRGSDGRPTWDKPAASDEEKARRAMAQEQWIAQQQGKTQ